MISPMISAVIIFGGFCGGFSGARISGEKGIVCGMLSGVIIFAAVWIIGGILSVGGFGISAITKALMIILSGSIGGIIGVNYIKRK
jgi:putative membrane protein (TIGR04086 family)